MVGYPETICLSGEALGPSSRTHLSGAGWEQGQEVAVTLATEQTLQWFCGPRCCEARQGQQEKRAGLNSRTRCEAGDIKEEQGKVAGRQEKKEAETAWLFSSVIQGNPDMGDLNNTFRGVGMTNKRPA